MGRGHAKPAGRSARSAVLRAERDSWRGAARSWEWAASPLQAPSTYTTYRNLIWATTVKLPRAIRDTAPAQIDFYALLGLEMVNDGA